MSLLFPGVFFNRSKFTKTHSAEWLKGSNDHFVVVGGSGVPSLVQFDGRPLGGANFQYLHFAIAQSRNRAIAQSRSLAMQQSRNLHATEQSRNLATQQSRNLQRIDHATLQNNNNATL
jgi:hypothetical protein